MKKTLILHHGVDLDGVLSGVIAKHYLTATADKDDVIITSGKDYGDNLDIIYNGFSLSDFDKIYVLDFSDDWLFDSEYRNKIMWIDHHQSAISKKYQIPQYCVDGVAACRLVFQYFTNVSYPFLDLTSYKNRCVSEPLFVALAGEYDIWDESSFYARPLNFGITNISFEYIEHLYNELKGVPAIAKNNHEQIKVNDTFNIIINTGRGIIDFIQRTSGKLNGGVELRMFGHKGRSFNTHIRSSLIHRLQDDEEFICVWNWTGGNKVKLSFYSEAIDVSRFAVHFGGGGHKSSCGCSVDLHILTAILTNQFKEITL